MSARSITREVVVTPTVAELAWAFSELSGAEQAQFFLEVDRAMSDWTGASAAMQRHSIGVALRELPLARYWVEDVAMSAGSDRPAPAPDGGAF